MANANHKRKEMFLYNGALNRSKFYVHIQSKLSRAQVLAFAVSSVQEQKKKSWEGMRGGPLALACTQEYQQSYRGQ